MVGDGSDALRNSRLVARDYSDELWTHHCAPFKGLSYKSFSFFNKDPARQSVTVRLSTSVASDAAIACPCLASLQVCLRVCFFVDSLLARFLTYLRVRWPCSDARLLLCSHVRLLAQASSCPFVFFFRHGTLSKLSLYVCLCVFVGHRVQQIQHRPGRRQCKFRQVNFEIGSGRCKFPD